MHLPAATDFETPWSEAWSLVPFFDAVALGRGEPTTQDSTADADPTFMHIGVRRANQVKRRTPSLACQVKHRDPGSRIRMTDSSHLHIVDIDRGNAVSSGMK